MRLPTLIGTFILGAACALIAATAISQHDHADHGHAHGDDEQNLHRPSPEDQQAMMELRMTMTSPGPEHAELDYFVGDWDTVIKLWVAGPDQPPMQDKGVSKTTWTLDKRFLLSEFTGTLMGMPYEGRGHVGYDRFKKKYISTWASNMGTNIHYMEGTKASTGNQWIYFGTLDEYFTGEHDKAVKYITTITDEDHYVFEVHALTMPGNTKIFQFEYTRRN